jgi:pSer/pThr/pTyr-binding forkhead associated (FHA) protein
VPRLRITTGPKAGQIIEVAGEVSLGRSTADATIEDAEISRRHVMVRVVPGALEIEDLKSANGTYVDGTKLDGPRQVGNGSQIRIGRTTLIVEEVVVVQATRISSVEDLDTTRARAIPDAEPGAIPQSAQPTRARQVTSDVAPQDATRARPVIGETPLQATRARSVPAPAAPSGAAPPPPAAPAPRAPSVAAAPAGAAAPAAPFRLPDRRRRSGLASRSWVPPVVSYGSVVLVAIALVIYFSSR